MNKKPYREYRLVNVGFGKGTVILREWFNPQSKRERQETAKALKFKAENEPMTIAQLRKRNRKAKQTFKKHPSGPAPVTMIPVRPKSKNPN
jgi:hypothetical protein